MPQRVVDVESSTIPSHQTRSAAFTRRDGLLALALLGPAGLLAACTGTSEPGPDATTEPSTAPVVEQGVATEEAELIALYDAAIAALADSPPDVVGVLTDLRDQHAAHRDALGGSTAEPTAPSAPGTVAAVIDGLIDAEREASRARIRSCTDADDPELARLLVFVGASEASHVPALRDLRP